MKSKEREVKGRDGLWEGLIRAALCDGGAVCLRERIGGKGVYLCA